MLVFGLITGAISVLCFALLIGIRIGRHLEANGIVKTSPNTASAPYRQAFIICECGRQHAYPVDALTNVSGEIQRT